MTKEPTAKRIGERIRVARNHSELTQRDASERLGCSDRSLSMWEGGKTIPPADAIAAMAVLFAVSADYLLGLRDHPSGLPVGQWIVDGDEVDAVLSARVLPELREYLHEGKLIQWASEVPGQPRVLGGRQINLLREKVETALRRLRAKAKRG